MNIFNKNRIIFASIISVSMIMLIGVVLLRNNNKETPNNSYKEGSSIKAENFGMYIKDSEGEYVIYEGNNWPSGYTLNSELSKCLDTNRNVIENAFTYTDGVLKITTNTTAYCYLYFDENAS